MSDRPKVLVVDDTPANVKLLADLLAIKGYGVATAATGEAALALMAVEKPDLVLLDVMMPGLSGYDVCRHIRADPETKLLPVVLVTSLDPQGERLKGIEAGADDFVSKPINQAELFARVRSLLRVKALQDEVTRQASELKAWNAKLEERVADQVAQMERLGQLKRFFSPKVADAIVSAGDASLLSPHRREICYVFTDLRGFTAFTDGAEPEDVQAVLREYHATMGAVITEFDGTIDRFAGDGILIFFNDPFPVSEPGTRAAAMALAMQARFTPHPDAVAGPRPPSRSRDRHRAGLRDARRVRLRRAARLFGHRQRRQSRGPAVRRGARRPDPDRSPAPVGAGRARDRRGCRAPDAERVRASGAGVRAQGLARGRR